MFSLAVVWYTNPQPKLVLWHNGKSYHKNLEFVIVVSCRVSCRGVNASRSFFLIMDFSSYSLFICANPLYAMRYARSLCQEECSVGLLNSFRSFFQFDTNAYSPCEWAGHFLCIHTHSTSIGSLFGHLFKAYQWQSISKMTARQNELNENMRIHSLHYFDDLCKLIVPQSLWFFSSPSKHCHHSGQSSNVELCMQKQRREWEKRMPLWKWIYDNIGCG